MSTAGMTTLFIFLPEMFLPDFLIDEQLSRFARFVLTAARMTGDSQSLQYARAKSWIALSCIPADLACTASDGYRVSQELGFCRIQMIARPPIWFNMLLLAWFIPWTGFTAHLWASFFGFVEPMQTEGSLLGTTIGFSFCWLAVFLFIAFINFYVIETRLYSERMEDRLGLPGFFLATTIEKDCLLKIVVIKRNGYKDELGEQYEDRWELCIVGRTKRELVLFGAVTIMSWIPRKERWTIETAQKPNELEWRSSMLAEWSGKTLQTG